MKNDFLIVAALQSESRERFETLGYPVLYTGVGKLNAAIHLLSYGLDRLNIKAIINLGTAVSGQYKPGTILQVSRFLQRDMLCQPLVPKYFTPFEVMEFPYLDLYNFDTDFFENVTCGTGDSFLSSCLIGREYEIADMEGFALAKVAKVLGIPLLSLKYVSDSGDSDEWVQSLDKASKALTEACRLLIDCLMRKSAPLPHHLPHPHTIGPRQY